MITITNTKVAGLEAKWASFRGFSLLFDNPGESLSPKETNLKQIDCPLDEQKDLQFYRCLNRWIDKVGRQKLINTYMFCPLPFNSYHVTVWDGLNDANVHKISDKK